MMKMAKHVIVGDIHGKEDKVKEALDKEGKKIFVGDFMDSYSPKQGPNPHGRHAQARCIDMVCDAIEKGEADACYGNHELSYMRPIMHRCSGYTSKKSFMFKEREARIRKLFKPYIFLTEDLLVSHAGIDRDLWGGFYFDKMTHEQRMKKLDSWWDDIKSPMHWVGKARGGKAEIGGMFWNDFNWEHEPVEGLYQIFGHTRGAGIRRKGSSYCIDCLDFKEATFLEIDL